MLRYPIIWLGGTAAEPTLKITKESEAMTPKLFCAIRKGFHLNQTELAAVMGYSGQSAISRIEHGVTVPPLAERLLQSYRWGYRPRDWPRDRNPAGK